MWSSWKRWSPVTHEQFSVSKPEGSTITWGWRPGEYLRVCVVWNHPSGQDYQADFCCNVLKHLRKNMGCASLRQCVSALEFLGHTTATFALLLLDLPDLPPCNFFCFLKIKGSWRILRQRRRHSAEEQVNKEDAGFPQAHLKIAPALKTMIFNGRLANV